MQNNQTLSTKPVIRVAPKKATAPPNRTSRRPRRKAKVLQRTTQPLTIRVSDRDVEVLRTLAQHRFLSGEQLRRLIFDCGASMVRRRLRALYDHRLIDRVGLVAQPTRGIPPFVYVLDTAGAAILADLGETVQTGKLDGRRLQHVRHRFLVNEFCITLTEACRRGPCRLAEWQHEEALLQPTITERPQAQSVRHPLLSKPTPFMPDGYFQLDPGGGQGSLAFFVEMDLSTHPLRKWKQRARLFAAYADPAHGLFRERFDRDNFRLLIVAPPPYRGRSRLTNILTTIQRELIEANVTHEAQLFLGTTLPELTADNVFGAIWRRPDQPNRNVSLLPNAGVRVQAPRNTQIPNRVSVKER